MNDTANVKSVEWKDDKLYILDQTLLPVEVVVEEQTSVEQVWDSIKKLKVRGAPAIGVAGAYGLVVAMRDRRSLERDPFLAELHKQADYLDSSRPTAVNLSWALKRVVSKVSAETASTGSALFERVVAEAVAIHREDVELCRRIGENGVGLIEEGMGLLTHCNAGRLATAEYGTATAPMYLAHEQGIRFRVYSDESRPLLQGSRLTAWELMNAGIEVYTITDSMAGFVMQQGLIDMVIVGTDRVAANGDVANKIGTMSVGILAKHFGIKFYVASPSSTIDMSTPTGAGIVIEERGVEEIACFGSRRTAPEGVKVRNPAFDVTPNELVTGIITDRGIVTAPYGENLKKLFGRA